MGRQSLAEQRRIEIGRALQACMLETGSFELTSVKDIAKKADIAAGLVHHYFNTKDEILIMMAELALQSVQNEMDDLFHTKEREAQAAKLHELLTNDSLNRFIVMLYSLSLSNEGIKEMITVKHDEMQQSLESRLHRNAAFQGDPAVTVAELMFLFESAVIHSATYDAASIEGLLMRAMQSAFPAAQ